LAHNISSEFPEAQGGVAAWFMRRQALGERCPVRDAGPKADLVSSSVFGSIAAGIEALISGGR
jgi:hypothetical protein